MDLHFAMLNMVHVTTRFGLKGSKVYFEFNGTTNDTLVVFGDEKFHKNYFADGATHTYFQCRSFDKINGTFHVIPLPVFEEQRRFPALGMFHIYLLDCNNNLLGASCRNFHVNCICGYIFPSIYSIVCGVVNGIDTPYFLSSKSIQILIKSYCIGVCSFFTGEYMFFNFDDVLLIVSYIRFYYLTNLIVNEGFELNKYEINTDRIKTSAYYYIYISFICYYMKYTYRDITIKSYVILVPYIVYVLFSGLFLLNVKRYIEDLRSVYKYYDYVKSLHQTLIDAYYYTICWEVVALIECLAFLFSPPVKFALFEAVIVIYFFATRTKKPITITDN